MTKDSLMDLEAPYARNFDVFAKDYFAELNF